MRMSTGNIILSNLSFFLSKERLELFWRILFHIFFVSSFVMFKLKINLRQCLSNILQKKKKLCALGC